MKPNPRATRRAAGFTLIELLVVIGIMSVIALLGGPKFYRLIQHWKLMSAAQQTQMLLRLARLEAIKTTGTTVVLIDTTSRTVTAFDDLNANLRYDAGEPQVAVYTLDKNLTLGTASGFTPDPRGAPYPPLAVFNSSGAVSAVGAFRIANSRGDQLEARVMSTNGGIVKLRKLQGATYIEPGEGGQQWTWN